MGLKIEETFQVSAPASRVWEFLVDPHEVVQCLPGAELLEARDENTFVGRVKVKVGPVTASYKGTATFVERDPSTRTVRMKGEGQDTSGGGSAKMTMVSQLEELADGRTAVRVDAEVDVAGRIVQFGRGMIEEVSRQLFRQFSECARTRLESESEAAPADPDAAADPQPSTGARGSAPEAPTDQRSAGPGPAAASAVPATGGGGGGTGQPVSTPDRPPTGAPRPGGATAAQPVRALPLLWSAIRAMLGRFFGRLSGRGR